MVPALRKSLFIVGLDQLITVIDDGNEEWQDDVDENNGKGVEVNPEEGIDEPVFRFQIAEGGIHVITV